MKMFDAPKTGMIGLPYGGKNYDDALSRFHTIPACHGQTDRRTDRITILISRVSSSMLTHDKNWRANPNISPINPFLKPPLCRRVATHDDNALGYASDIMLSTEVWTVRGVCCRSGTDWHRGRSAGDTDDCGMRPHLN